MRNFFTQEQTNNDSATEQARRSSLTVVHCNKHIASAGRITTTYIVNNDIVERHPKKCRIIYYPIPMQVQPTGMNIIPCRIMNTIK
ncbi:MAG: hypothetical protein IPN56_14065 [Chitinophagaceae bacterium]|nr:hypothetical protein [Chitinophagaceae bacterium]